MSREINIAIETSSPKGSIAIGRGDQLLLQQALPDRRRHSVELMSTIDQMMRELGEGPDSVAEVYVSAGPGSFTGLRVAISIAQMLGEAGGVKLVSVPTIEATALNADSPQSLGLAGDTLLAVAINTKRQTAYTQVFAWDGRWLPRESADVRDFAPWLGQLPRPIALLGDHLPEVDDDLWRDVTRLPGELTVARAECVWQIGRSLAAAGRYVDPARLLPIYARRPEAVELWEQRHGS